MRDGYETSNHDGSSNITMEILELHRELCNLWSSTNKFYLNYREVY